MEFELPKDLTAREERIVLAALEKYFHSDVEDAWLLAGRIENTGWGALQARRHTEHAWTDSAFFPHLRRGTTRLWGRGDAR
ncbi:MAG: hypothetical protein HY658_06035 [Actinobacteria bacterium]|nr:hypothetical protein [Actinomycetota bacterium]